MLLKLIEELRTLVATDGKEVIDLAKWFSNCGIRMRWTETGILLFCRKDLGKFLGLVNPRKYQPKTHYVVRMGRGGSPPTYMDVDDVYHMLSRSRKEVAREFRDLMRIIILQNGVRTECHSDENEESEEDEISQLRTDIEDLRRQNAELKAQLEKLMDKK